jgi:hypothetical protein
MMSTHCSRPTDGFNEEALLKLHHCSMLRSHKGRGKSGLCRNPYLGIRGLLTYRELSPWESFVRIRQPGYDLSVLSCIKQAALVYIYSGAMYPDNITRTRYRVLGI